jgi:hypothetical protein
MRFYDAEKRVIDFLSEQLEEDTKVGTRVPAKGAKFVKLVQTGGSRMTRVSDGPVLTIEAYAPSDVEARELMEDVRELLSLMHIGQQIPGAYVYRVVEAGNLINLPDPLHSSHRYSMPFQVHMRGKRTTRSLK